MTYCTGIRSGCSAGSVPTGTDSRYSRRVGPAIPGGAGGPVDDVVAEQRRERHRLDVDDAEAACADETNSATMRVERRAGRQSTRSILLTASATCRTPSSAGDREVPAGLLDDAVASVDEDQGELGGRGAGDHVAGVLDVARGVGEDVRPGGGREVAVGDVDGDALLALGAQAVGEQGQVGRVEAAVAADALDGRELVRENRLGVVQQPARRAWTSRRRRLPAVASRSRSCRGAPGSRSESGAE